MKYYYYTRSIGIKEWDSFDKIPPYLTQQVYETKDEAYAHFLRKKNMELQTKIQNAEEKIQEYKKRMQENEKDFGYTKEMFPEIFV